MAHDDDRLLQRFAAGEALTAEEQVRLAAALRADPGLRRRLRGAAVGEARLARAVRAAGGATRRTRRVPVPRTTLIWLAAAAVLVLAGGALVWWIAANPASDGESTLAALPPETVAPQGAFALADRPGAMVLDRSRVEFEAGSAGSMTRVADASPVVNLASGGALLRMAPGSDELRVEAGPATITAKGDVAVRYLDVPEGGEPAIQVEVVTGQARVVSGGVSHELKRGETKVVALAGRISATVESSDPKERRLVLQARGGAGRVSWTVGWDAVPQLGARQQPVPAQALEAGWLVQVQLDAARREVVAIDVPDQTVTGTVGSWDAASRGLTLLRDRRSRPEAWTVPAELPVDHAAVGRQARLTIDPATRQVLKFALVEQHRHQAVRPPEPPSRPRAP